MSLSVTTYYCLNCTFKQVDFVHWGVREYLLPNDARVPMEWSLGWCEQCKGLAAVEIPCTTELSEAIRRTAPEFSQLPPRATRCLACGSGQVTAPLLTSGLTWSNRKIPAPTGFIHPNCGGELWRMQDGFRVALRQSIKTYTIDGEFIEQVFDDRL